MGDEEGREGFRRVCQGPAGFVRERFEREGRRSGEDQGLGSWANEVGGCPPGQGRKGGALSSEWELFVFCGLVCGCIVDGRSRVIENRCSCLITIRIWFESLLGSAQDSRHHCCAR